MAYILEVCVDSTASALAAKEGGADRLELCADLIVGGTTPSLALVRQVKETTGLPVRALLRPRFGDFCYDRWELAQMVASAQRPSRQCPAGRSPAPAARGAGGGPHRDSGGCGGLPDQPPRPHKGDGRFRLPPLRQAGARQPDDLPPGGRPHGAARFLGVRALADQRGHHPKRPHCSGYAVTKRSRHWMWRDRFVYLSCFKASLTST